MMSKYRKEISQQEFEEIERYLNGQMDLVERAAFEDRISEDNRLREEVELQRQLISTVEAAAFKATTRLPTQDHAIPVTNTIMRYWRYAAAAVLILGLGLTGWWVYRSQPVSRQDLFTSYFHKDPGLPIVMSSDTVTYTFNRGMILYKEENYDGAIRVWEKMISQKGTTDTLEYYIGVAWINSNKLAEAQPYLERTAGNANSIFREKATWYLALLRLKQKDYNNARILLQQLPDKKTAIELLDKIPE